MGWKINLRNPRVPSSGTHYGSAISGYFIDHDLVGDAAQRGLLLNRDDRLLVQDGGDRRRLDHGPGDVNLLRGRQALNPCGDIDGLAEIILPLVEHDGKTRTFMNPD